MFLIQRIFEGAGEEGKDIRETLAKGFGDPDAALKHLKNQFKSVPDDPEIEVDITYNSKTRRFTVIPKERQELLYHIVALNEVDLIDKEGNSAKDSSK